MFLCCTVHTVMCHRVGLHLQLHDHWPASPSRTTRHGYMATPTTTVYYLGLATDITLRGGVNSLGGLLLTFPDDLRSPNICLHANARLGLPAIYSASKNPETKTPHTCLSQPHGGYCLPVPASKIPGQLDMTCRAQGYWYWASELLVKDIVTQSVIS
jgi:hypothetical protein